MSPPARRPARRHRFSPETLEWSIQEETPSIDALRLPVSDAGRGSAFAINDMTPFAGSAPEVVLFLKSLSDISVNSDLHRAKAIVIASVFAKEFNQRVHRRVIPLHSTAVLELESVHNNQSSKIGVVESKADAESHHDPPLWARQVPRAFAHFTHQRTEGKVCVLLDRFLQVSQIHTTRPHTKDEGFSDLAADAVAATLQTHTCSALCGVAQLPRLSGGQPCDVPWTADQLMDLRPDADVANGSSGRGMSGRGTTTSATYSSTTTSTSSSSSSSAPAPATSPRRDSGSGRDRSNNPSIRSASERRAALRILSDSRSRVVHMVQDAIHTVDTSAARRKVDVETSQGLLEQAHVEIDKLKDEVRMSHSREAEAVAGNSRESKIAIDELKAALAKQQKSELGHRAERERTEAALKRLSDAHQEEVAAMAARHKTLSEELASTRKEHNRELEKLRHSAQEAQNRRTQLEKSSNSKIDALMRDFEEREARTKAASEEFVDRLRREHAATIEKTMKVMRENKQAEQEKILDLEYRLRTIEQEKRKDESTYRRGGGDTTDRGASHSERGQSDQVQSSTTSTTKNAVNNTVTTARPAVVPKLSLGALSGGGVGRQTDDTTGLNLGDQASRYHHTTNANDGDDNARHSSRSQPGQRHAAVAPALSDSRTGGVNGPQTPQANAPLALPPLPVNAVSKQPPAPELTSLFADRRIELGFTSVSQTDPQMLGKSSTVSPNYCGPVRRRAQGKASLQGFTRVSSKGAANDSGALSARAALQSTMSSSMDGGGGGGGGGVIRAISSTHNVGHTVGHTDSVTRDYAQLRGDIYNSNSNSSSSSNNNTRRYGGSDGTTSTGKPMTSMGSNYRSATSSQIGGATSNVGNTWSRLVSQPTMSHGISSQHQRQGYHTAR